MADVRSAILARLDAYEAEHRPMIADEATGCCPGGCVVDAVSALRAVVECHEAVPTGGMGRLPGGDYGPVEPACAACGVPDEYAITWPCPTLLRTATALRITVDGGGHGG